MLIRAPTHTETTTIPLSPFDIVNRGRSIPLCWFYEEALDKDALVSSLAETLQFYPHLCGRYSDENIALNNAGVPLEFATAPSLDAARAHLLGDGPRAFDRAAHEACAPDKTAMDPDPATPSTPLLSVKVTRFDGGGTALGVLVQHGVCDADAAIAFVTAWSRAFRGLPPPPPPTRGRLAVLDGPGGGACDTSRVAVVRPGERFVPEFAGVMDRIAGDAAVRVPIHAATLKRWKADVPRLPSGEFVSADDLVTARTWRALARVRVAQVGLGGDSDAPTTVMRAVNVRKRTEPPLGDDFAGNAAVQAWTTCSVKELLASSVVDVARRLRRGLDELTPASIASLARWHHARHEEGCQTKYTFDANALT